MKLDRKELWKKEEAEIRRIQTWRPLALQRSTAPLERRSPTEFGRRPMPEDEIDEVTETRRSNRLDLFMRILGI